MDVTVGTEGAYRRIADSLASTQAELAQANALLSELGRADNSRRQTIERQLTRIAQAIELREQGRLNGLLPEDPRDAEVVVSGLRGFADKIEVKLTEQAGRLRRGRRTWAGASSGLAVLSAGPPAFIAASTLTTTDGPAPSLVAIAGLASTAILAAAVVCFRIYQIRDESERRLQEKSLALAFLEAAIELAEAKPQAASILEKSFDMFLAHYEASQAPLTASDLAPGK